MAYWVDNNTAVKVRPKKNAVASAVATWFSDQLGQTPTIPQADWFNMVQGEILGLADALGVKPDKLNDAQLGVALKAALNKLSTDITNIKVPKVLDSFGDSRTDAGSQRTINEANKAAVQAQKTANQVNDKAVAAQSRADAAHALATTADSKAVAAQSRADSAYDRATTGINEAAKKVPIFPKGLSEELLSDQLFGGFGLGVKSSGALPADSPVKSAMKLMQIGIDIWPTQIVFDSYQNQAFLRARKAGSGAFHEWSKFLLDSDIPASQLFFFDTKIVPVGFLELAGQAISLAQYPKLYAEYGATLPNRRDRYFRAANGTRAGAAGTLQDDAIRNITGAFGEIGSYSSTAAYEAGALFRSTATSTAQANGNSSAGTFRINFDASRVVATADENRPLSVSVLVCVKAQ